MHKFICSASLILLLAITSGNAAQPPVEKLLQRCQVPADARGVCVVKQNGDLAIALAHATQLLILAHEADASSVEKLAAQIKETDWRTTGRFYLYESTTCVVADHYANFYIQAGMDAGKLMAGSPDDVIRKLVPCGGRAVLHFSTGTKTDLRTWVQKGTLAARSEIAEDDSGLWLTLTRERLDGSEDWSHHNHGADNNWVSKDSALRAPLGLQWMQLPHYSPSLMQGQVVSGRMYAFYQYMSGNQAEMKNVPLSNAIIVRDLYNGRLLWEREMATDLAPVGSGMVAANGELWARDGAGKEIYCFDPETGTVKGKIPADTRPGSLSAWIASSDGLLYVVSGPKSLSRAAMESSLPSTHYDFLWATMHGVNWDRMHVCGDKVTAYDLKTRKPVWSFHMENEAVDGRTFCASNGKVFFGARDGSFRGVEAASGKVLWTRRLTDPAIAPAFELRKSSMQAVPVPHFPAAYASPEAVVISWIEGKDILALSATDGKTLWQKPRLSTSVWIDGKQVIQASVNVEGAKKGWPIGRRAESNVGHALNLLTGEIAGDVVGFGRVSCTMTPVSTCGYWSSYGMLYDRAAGKPYIEPGDYFRIPCMYAQPLVLGGGLAVASPYDVCNCWHVFRGSMAWGNVTDNTEALPFDAAAALERSAVDSSLQSLPVDSLDWHTHRGNNAHTGASAVTIGPKLKELWTLEPLNRYPVHPYVPDKRTYDPQLALTPAATAGDLLFIGSGEGTLRCLRSSDGAAVWTKELGGRIYQTPTVADGRLYVGCADGYAYCFEAATGRRLWRFKLAPKDAVILTYNQPASRWPVTSGVLVQDGVAYAAAGLIPNQGVVVCALDARTGALKWRTTKTSHLYPDGVNRIAACGGIAIAGGKLWVRTYFAPHASFDLKTGVVSSLPNEVTEQLDPNYPVGAEMGVFAGNYVVQGGRPWYYEESFRVTHRSEDITFTKLDKSGKALSPSIVGLKSSMITPAWDESGVLVVPVEGKQEIWSSAQNPWSAGYHQYEYWETSKTVAYLDDIQKRFEGAANPPSRKYPTGFKYQKYYHALLGSFNSVKAEKDKVRIAHRPAVVWGPVQVEVYVLALAKNAAIVIKQPKFASSAAVMSILDRSTGKTISENTLPELPVSNGISITRDGKIIVPLQDGRILCFGKS